LPPSLVLGRRVVRRCRQVRPPPAPESPGRLPQRGADPHRTWLRLPARSCGRRGRRNWHPTWTRPPVSFHGLDGHSVPNSRCDVLLDRTVAPPQRRHPAGMDPRLSEGEAMEKVRKRLTFGIFACGVALTLLSLLESATADQ